MSDDIRKGQDSSDAHGKTETEERRSFLRRTALLGSAPVILSLFSRPAMGAFCSPSSIGSTTHLSHHPDEQSCGGLSPGAWKGDQGAGQDPAGVKNNTFSGLFGGPWHNGHGVNWPVEMTLNEVLNNYFPNGLSNPHDQHEFGSHAAAAYLNAYYKDTQTNYVMTTVDVIEMINAVIINGYYEPTPGYVMDAQNVVAFIQQTFH